MIFFAKKEDALKKKESLLDKENQNWKKSIGKDEIDVKNTYCTLHSVTSYRNFTGVEKQAPSDIQCFP